MWITPYSINQPLSTSKESWNTIFLNYLIHYILKYTFQTINSVVFLSLINLSLIIYCSVMPELCPPPLIFGRSVILFQPRPRGRADYSYLSLLVTPIFSPSGITVGLSSPQIDRSLTDVSYFLAFCSNLFYITQNFTTEWTLWQYGLWSFQTGGTKLERFLPKNQHTQRKLFNFENWISGGLRSFQKSEF